MVRLLFTYLLKYIYLSLKSYRSKAFLFRFLCITTVEFPEMISGIVSVLIISGLDAHYVLNEMEICDLPLYIEAYEKKRKEEMESARMWTYLTILPHIDARKMENGAKDLITFPWEEAEKQAEKEIKETEIERFELFMQKGKDLLNL